MDIFVRPTMLSADMIKSSGVDDVTGVKKVFLGQLVGRLLILNVADGVGDTGQKSMDFR